ncbi:seipin-like isoform X1 [Ostrea edulis]|uniref:seipin-like isoform X1 n=1 Tax=Ostrea edulis TaxID=37623 RepID=UPI002095F154|nr:seipin-like isoform X1 [Ostrea edulis]
MILMFVYNILGWLKDSFDLTLSKLKNIVTRIAVIIAVFVILLWFSAFLYGSFYFAYMPPVSLIKRVNLQFKICDDGVEICSYPADNITLVNEGQSEVFARGEAYSIILETELPESPINKELGMVMVKLQLYDKTGQTVACSSRSVMLHYRSELLRIIDTFVFSPLLLSGFAEQKQSLNVDFYRNYIDDSYNPAIGAYIEVQNLKIQIYSATLKIHAHFTGLRYMLFHWPLLSAAIGTTLNMCLLSFMALLSWYQIYYSRGNGNSFEYEPDRKPKDRSEMEERRKNIREMLAKERKATVAQMTGRPPPYSEDPEQSSKLETMGSREDYEDVVDSLIAPMDLEDSERDFLLRHRRPVISS